MSGGGTGGKTSSGVEPYKQEGGQETVRLGWVKIFGGWPVDTSQP